MSELFPGYTVQEPTADNYRWARHLLRNVPVLAMVTEGSHVTTMYATFTEELDGNLQYVFRSRRSTRHSKHIEAPSDPVESKGRAAARVLLHLCDTTVTLPSLKLNTHAQLLSGQEAVRALDVMNSIRKSRGAEERDLAFYCPEDQPLGMYAATILDESTMPGPIFDSHGHHVDEGHMYIPLAELKGFGCDE